MKDYYYYFFIFLMKRLSLITRPSVSWGPLLAEDRLKSWDLHEKRGTTMGGKVDPNARPHEPVIMSRIAEEPDGGAPRTFHYAVFENEPETDVLP